MCVYRLDTIKFTKYKYFYKIIKITENQHDVLITSESIEITLSLFFRMKSELKFRLRTYGNPMR